MVVEQTMIVTLIPLAIFGATMAGGLIGLHLSQRIPLFLGFSAGAVLGVALFDILPAAVRINRRTAPDIALFSWVAAGFLLFLVLDRIVSSTRRGSSGPPAFVYTASSTAWRSAWASMCRALSELSSLRGSLPTTSRTD